MIFRNIINVTLLLASISLAANDRGLVFLNANEFGFSPDSTGLKNTQALQRAVDQGGTIIVSQPGEYKISGTVMIGSNTSLEFGEGVWLKKTDESGSFSHVFLNKGALTKTYDEHITIKGLNLKVNGIDKWLDKVYGLRGQLGFFYVKDLKIQNFRCYDLTTMQFGIHVCTFEDLIIDDVIIHGKKDGVHLGRGKRFTIRNGVFKTYDDAIALNAHDYATSNPELGWIEDGVIENCHDLNAENTTGYFCRILAGAWIDWQKGMEVQQSDAVVHNGRIYRVQMDPDGQAFKSVTPPTHESGHQEYDGINWGVVQEDITYTAGVRNVVFRDIYLKKPRIAFSVHFDNDKYSRSYYPGAEIPIQEQLFFDNIKINYEENHPFISVNTPMDVITITNSSFGTGGIQFHGNQAMDDYLPTRITIMGSVFKQKGNMTLLENTVSGKQVKLQTLGNTVLDESFTAVADMNEGELTVDSDLNGLAKQKTKK